MCGKMKARKEDDQKFDIVLEEYFFLVWLNQVLVCQQYFNHALAVFIVTVLHVYSSVTHTHTHVETHIKKKTCEQLTLCNVFFDYKAEARGIQCFALVLN